MVDQERHKGRNPVMVRDQYEDMERYAQSPGPRMNARTWAARMFGSDTVYEEWVVARTGYASMEEP